MTHERECELLAHVPTLATLAEADSFRCVIVESETMGAELYRALMARIDLLAAREGRK